MVFRLSKCLRFWISTLLEFTCQNWRKLGRNPLKQQVIRLFIALTMFTCCIIMRCFHDGIQNSCPGCQHSTNLVCGLTQSCAALLNGNAIGQAICLLVKRHVMSQKITFFRSGKLKCLSKAFSSQKYNKPGKSISLQNRHLHWHMREMRLKNMG